MNLPVPSASLPDTDDLAIVGDTEDVTRAEAWVAARALAVALQTKDPVAGSCAAVCAELSPAALVALVAVHLAGKICLVLDPSDSDDALQRKLDASPPSTLIVDDAGATRLRGDADDTITFGQFPGLVQTYAGRNPVDVPVADTAGVAPGETLIVTSLSQVPAGALAMALAAGTRIVIKA